MEITVYDKKTKKIKTILSGSGDVTKNIDLEIDDFVYGKHDLNGYIVDGRYTKKEMPYPDYPASNVGDLVKYNNDDGALKKAICNIESIPKQERYKVLRSINYPDVSVFLDGLVKMNSAKKSRKQSGAEQLEDYYKKCNDVKDRFPREDKEE